MSSTQTVIRFQSFQSLLLISYNFEKCVESYFLKLEHSDEKKKKPLPENFLTIVSSTWIVIQS